MSQPHSHNKKNEPPGGVLGQGQDEALLKQSFEFLSSLHKLLRLSLLAVPIEEVLSQALEELLAIPWLSLLHKGGVFLVDDKDCLVLKAQGGLHPQPLSSCATVPFGHCLCGKAAQSGELIHTAALGPDHEVTYEGMRPHGHYVVPIRLEQRTLGVIVLYLAEGHPSDPREAEFLRAVADILAGIIARKKVEESLRRSDAILRQVQKMDAIDKLAAGAAHDFNNLITLISGHAAILFEGLPEGEARESAHAIQMASKSVASLTGKLLAFSREAPLAPKDIDLNASVASTVDLLGLTLGKDIRFILDLAPTGAKAWFDPVQFEQIVINIAVNARDAMPDGGELSFKTGRVRLDTDAVKHMGVAPGEYAVLDISDTGTGMSEEVQSRIFKPFFTTKPPGQGTGLGLAMVAGIVKGSGGAVSVHSQPGNGTRFRLYLPTALA